MISTNHDRGGANGCSVCRQQNDTAIITRAAEALVFCTAFRTADRASHLTVRRKTAYFAGASGDRKHRFFVCKKKRRERL